MMASARIGRPAGPGSSRAMATTRPQTRTRISATTKMKMLFQKALTTSGHFSSISGRKKKVLPTAASLASTKADAAERHEREGAPAEGQVGTSPGRRRVDARCDDIVASTHGLARARESAWRGSAGQNSSAVPAMVDERRRLPRAAV